MRRTLSFASFVSFALCIAHSATAVAAPVTLSAIPLASDAIPEGHGTLRFVGVRKVADTFVTALDSAVCVGTGGMDESMGQLFETALHDVFVERLVQGPEPVFERTRFERVTATSTNATIIGRSRVRLASIGTAELPVYAYRTTKAVHILVVRGFNSPREAFDSQIDQRTGCGFVHVTLEGNEDSATRNVTAAHPFPESARWIAGWEELSAYEAAKHPDFDAPRFLVNVSLSKVSRDPEPILSLTVRSVPKGAP